MTYRHLRLHWVGMLIMLILFVFGGMTPVYAQDTAIEASTVYTDVYETVSPSVVSISVVARRDGSSMLPNDETVVGGGTGFVLDQDGHIMTNNHVVDGATEIEVSFTDGTLASARIVGLDPDSDLAVLQVDLPADDLAELQPVTFGNSDNLIIGQPVLAIGSPFGQRWTLTSGIISALDRSIQGLTNFSIGGVIQTDAAINPGNSGGPLLNLQGEVVGVNSQIISGTRSSAGIGFAIPGNLAQRVANRLIDIGYVEYSYVGLSGRDVYLPLIEAFNLPNDTQAVVVAEVSPGGPADRAGLVSAQFDEEAVTPRTAPSTVDLIREVNGERITSMNDFISYLAVNTQPGDTITLTVERLTREQVETLELKVRLMPRP